MARLACLALLLAACAPAPAQEAVAEVVAPTEVVEPDLFAAWLDQGPVADGFDLPVSGSGWTGCGDGCWTRKSAAAVRNIGVGVVVASDAGALRIRHRWYENASPREIVSAWEGLSGGLAVGATVGRGQALGNAASVQLRLEGTDEAVGAFLAARPSLFVPQAEAVLGLVSHDARQLRVYHHGEESARFEVGFGQEEGAKDRLRDLRTPKGIYFVIARSRGPFSGKWADYYGGLWLKLNYPNAWDAARGVDEGLITADQQRSIATAWRQRAPTLENTGLGGGIGIHAWAGAWDLEGDRRLSFGCVVVQPDDADKVDAALPVGSMVALF